MTNIFSFLSFAVFEDVCLNDLRELFFKEYKSKIIEGFFCLSNEPIPFDLYIEPQHDPNPKTYSFWKDSLHDRYVFYMSNLIDGYLWPINFIHKHVHCNSYFCKMSNENDLFYLGYFFYVYSSDGAKRHIQAIQDEKRWEFYEDGNPLPFEDLALYNNRLVKKRINNDIIKMYISKLGIEFKDIGENIVDSFTCRRYWDI